MNPEMGYFNIELAVLDNAPFFFFFSNSKLFLSDTLTLVILDLLFFK